MFLRQVSLDDSCRMSGLIRSSGGFGALRKGKNRGSATMGFPRARGGGFGSWVNIGCRGLVANRLFHFGLRFDVMDIGVGNFPPEITALPANFHVLLEKDGTSGIATENSRGRQQHISRPILH